MKKEQEYSKSFERYFQPVIHIIISSDYGISTRKEIEVQMVYHGICKSRQVTKILDYMTSRNYLAREKIRGSKRFGYVINEEIIGEKNESFVTVGLTKRGKPIYDRMTQTELNQEFKNMIERYKKTIAKKKSEMNNNDVLFYVLHVTFITITLSWISRLILSIKSGLFHHKIGKITIANKNVEILEGFLETLCHNLKNKFPDEKYNMALSGIFYFFETLDPFERTEYSRKTMEASSLIH